MEEAEWKEFYELATANRDEQREEVECEESVEPATANRDEQMEVEMPAKEVTTEEVVLASASYPNLDHQENTRVGRTPLSGC